jgi:hypothetical protein
MPIEGLVFIIAIVIVETVTHRVSYLHDVTRLAQIQRDVHMFAIMTKLEISDRDIDQAINEVKCGIESEELKRLLSVSDHLFLHAKEQNSLRENS